MKDTHFPNTITLVPFVPPEEREGSTSPTSSAASVAIASSTIGGATSGCKTGTEAAGTTGSTKPSAGVAVVTALLTPPSSFAVSMTSASFRRLRTLFSLGAAAVAASTVAFSCSPIPPDVAAKHAFAGRPPEGMTLGETQRSAYPTRTRLPGHVVADPRRSCHACVQLLLVWQGRVDDDDEDRGAVTVKPEVLQTNDRATRPPKESIILSVLSLAVLEGTHRLLNVVCTAG